MPRVRVIGSDGEMIGVLTRDEALALAEEEGLDLVEIQPQADPPVCKVMDYGKFRFEQAKREKEAKKNQRVVEIKEIRLSLNIDTHDFETKVGHAQRFLNSGNKVKVSIRFRGREMAHMASSRHVLDDFAKQLADVATVEKAPKVEGRSMTMFLTEKR